MKHILIVEDEEDIARLLQMKLQQEGFKVSKAIDGTLAVSAAHNLKPDLIILDLMLPGGDGLSVLKRLKQSVHVSSIPIIILTSKKDEDYKKKVLQFGVEAYMNKPFVSDELVEKIRELTHRGE